MICAMSATRLLLLGAVRIFQPVHGYFVRRELMSWQADAWANLNPGSVYNGLRSLARDGFVEEAGTETEGGRPARTTYRLTGDGETEFLRLLREALWNVSRFEPADLMAAWSFAWALGRDEVIAALESRLEQIEASRRAVGYAIADIPSTDTPATVAEHYRLGQARLDGEAAWARQLLERLRAGEYWFDGEPNPPWSTPPPGGARTVHGAAS
jgi:DNA-binding PadR family transcriptional regulator